MNDEQENQTDSIYEPRLVVRLAWWFGIYFAAYLFPIWCWPGEIYDWTSPIGIPGGLLWLSYGVFGPWVDKYEVVVLFLAYGIYLIHLGLTLWVMNRNVFWALVAIFVAIICISSYGSMMYGGITIGMSDAASH